MKLKNKFRITAFIAATIICFVVIYLNLLSHEKTQKIYLDQTDKIILNLKKDFLKDTVNNMILEIDRLRATKYSYYKMNAEARLRRIHEELNLTEEEFLNFYINKFENDNNFNMWTAILWDKKTGQILYNSTELNRDTLDSTVENIKSMLSSYVTIEKGNMEGLFGVSKTYIDEIVKDEIADIIRNRKFSNDSYIWVNEVINFEGGKDYAIRRVHPNLRETEGMLLSTEMEDIKGNLPYLEELEGIKKEGEIYFTYYFKKLNSSLISEKITYAKLYKDFNWIIAMGVHLDDIDAYTELVNNKIHTLSNEYIIKLLRYIFVVLIIGFAILYLIEKKHFTTSTKSLVKEINFDTLTKAFSRRYGERNLNAIFKQYRVNGDKPAILMFDIDDFKHINDKYGHSVGDKVLIEVVKTVNRRIRSSDQLIRWGGDEFIVILPGLKEAHIREYGQKIIDEISSNEIAIENDTMNDTIKITISMGISYFKETDTTHNDVLKRADEALYMSKDQGKNRINILI